MTRAPAMLVVLVGLLVLPAVASAQSGVTVLKMRLLDENGHELRIAPADGLVTLQTIVRNDGSSTLNGTLTLSLKIEAVDGSFSETHSVAAQGPVEHGKNITFDYGWTATARSVGDYKATAQMTSPSSGGALVAQFSVADSAVPAGTFAERASGYYWVFGVFLLAIVLFFVVVGARRS